MTAAHLALGFGSASTLLYIVWGICSYFTTERHMCFALLGYAFCNVALMYPLWKGLL